MRRLALVDFALIVLVGTLAIRQCCIPIVPPPSHSPSCPHEGGSQKPSSCHISDDQALVDRSATTINVAAADIDHATHDLPSKVERFEVVRPSAIPFDLGPPNLFLQNSAFLI